MKTAKAKSGKTGLKRSTPARRGTRKPMDMESIRRQINDLVGSQAVGMVETTIAEADKGHYAAMKYLFEMVGLYPATEQEGQPGDDSLAKILLKRIGELEDTASTGEVTKEFTGTGAETTTGDDAVE